MTDKLVMKIIPFAEWRTEIAPLWMRVGGERYIGPTVEAHGQIQYPGPERPKSMLCFPIAAEYENERIGWTSVFNLSNEAIRIRGIYVLPEFRANGVGYRMVQHAMSLWPAPWKRCFMYARPGNVQRFARWGFEVVPGMEPRSWPEGRSFGGGDIVLMQKSMRDLPS
jgi:GNAT superfamily N-acetyltransferase